MAVAVPLPPGAFIAKTANSNGSIPAVTVTEVPVVAPAPAAIATPTQPGVVVVAALSRAGIHDSKPRFARVTMV
jgi:hypothetical protein